MIKKRLSKTERTIGERFIRLRKILGQSQQSLADGLRLPLDRVVAVENYRTCLKLDMAVRLIGTYGVNPGWLAEYAGPVFLKVELDLHSMVLSQSFNDSLAECYEPSGMKAKVASALATTYPPCEGGESAAATRSLIQLANDWTERKIPSDHLWTFVAEMEAHAKLLLKGWNGGELSQKREVDSSHSSAS